MRRLVGSVDLRMSGSAHQGKVIAYCDDMHEKKGNRSAPSSSGEILVALYRSIGEARWVDIRRQPASYLRRWCTSPKFSSPTLEFEAAKLRVRAGLT